MEKEPIPKYKDIPSCLPGILIHVTYSTSESSDEITLHGHAIDRLGRRITGSKTLTRTAENLNALPAKEAHLVAAVISALPTINTKASIKPPEKVNSAMEAVLAEIKMTGDPITMAWSPQVRAQHITYFERNILPFLSSHKEEWLPEDTNLLRQALIEKVLKNGRSKGLESRAELTVNVHLMASSTIYSRMREVNAELRPIDLTPHFQGSRHHQGERIKSLTRDVRRRLAQAITQLIDENPRLALAGILMYDCGLRTAEASAVHETEIILHTDLGVASVAVIWQERNGKRDALLKSGNAYRIVPLTFWGQTMVMRCLAKIGPLANDAPLCLGRDLSAKIREILTAAGLSSDDMAAADKTQQQYPDFSDDGKVQYDICAYLLRHDWASRARNICGLTSPEIDYLLGHSSSFSKRMRADLREPEYQADLSQRLERYVHDASISQHPAVSPILLEHGMDIDLPSFQEIQLVNNSDEPIFVDLDFFSAEAVDNIEIICPKSSMLESVKKSKNTHCYRTNRPTIGELNLTKERTDQNEKNLILKSSEGDISEAVPEGDALGGGVPRGGVPRGGSPEGGALGGDDSEGGSPREDAHNGSPA